MLSAMIQFGCLGNRSVQNGQQRSLLAVLCFDKSIYIIDAEKMEVLNRVKLRSLCLDFTAGKDDKIYTSQTGGVGTDADDAIGVVDVRRGKVERYINLKAPNPGAIAYKNDKVVVINGIMLKSGNLIGEIIEPQNNYNSTAIELLGITYGPSLNLRGKKLYMSTQVRNKQSPSTGIPESMYFSLDLETKQIRKVLKNIIFASVVFDDKGKGYGLIPREWGNKPGMSNQVGFKDKVVIFDPEKGKIIKTIELEQQSMSANRLLLHNSKLYINFFNDANPQQSTGDTIGILDLKTEKMRTIKGFKGPSWVLPTGDRIYVANHDSNSVDVIDEKTGRKLSAIKVGEVPLSMVYVGTGR